MLGMAPGPGIPPLPAVALSSLSWAFPGLALLPPLGPCPPSRLDNVVPLHCPAVVLTPWNTSSMGSACISMGVATRILLTGLAAAGSGGTA